MGAETEALLRTYEASAASVALYTVSVQGSRSRCTSWTAPFQWAEVLEAAEERALRQANTLGGVHAFCLEVCDAKGAALGTEYFRVTAEAFGANAMVSEPANEAGVLAQQMRLTEAVFRTQVLGAEKLLDKAAKMIERADKRAENFESRYVESLNVVASVITGEREFALEMAKVEKHAESKAVLVKKIASMVPVVTGAFLAKNAGPKGAAHASAVRAKGLFETINPQQFRAILELLQPEQQAALFDLMKGLAAEAEAEQQAEGATEHASKH